MRHASEKEFAVHTPAPKTSNYRLWTDESAPIRHTEGGPPASAEVVSGQSARENSQTALQIQLMSISAGMVGICLTVIGLFQIVAKLQKVGTLADDLVAVDSMLFLAVCICAYHSIRTENKGWQRRLEQLADLFFMIALTFMTVICGIIAWLIA